MSDVILSSLGFLSVALFCLACWWGWCSMMTLRTRYVGLLDNMRKSAEQQAEATHSAVALLKGELEEAHAKLRESQATTVALEARAAADRAHMDWMKMVVNQLQKERAVLMQKATGLQFPYPELQESVQAEDPLEMFNHQSDSTGQVIATPADPGMANLLAGRPMSMFEHKEGGYTE